MKKDHIINWQGQDFVKYEGLLDEAHQQGLKRINTILIQVPHDEDGRVAIVSAEVETEKGVFTGIGDASPENVRGTGGQGCVRVAEDRAKARALRDAVNVGQTSVEELALGEEQSGARDEALAGGTPEQNDAHRPEAPKASPFKAASANQLATIAKLSRLLGHPEEPSDEMTSAEASERITQLSREYNERKGAGRRTA